MTKNLSREKVMARVEEAKGLMRTHGLVDWKLEIDKAKARAGSCKYKKRVISISNYYLWRADDADFKDTILHEIAHALCGHAAKHGPVWQATARSIGCTADRCVDLTDIAPKTRYAIKCPCGEVNLQRHVVHRSLRDAKCRKCGEGVRVFKSV